MICENKTEMIKTDTPSRNSKPELKNEDERKASVQIKKDNMNISVFFAPDSLFLIRSLLSSITVRPRITRVFCIVTSSFKSKKMVANTPRMVKVIPIYLVFQVKMPFDIIFLLKRENVKIIVPRRRNSMVFMVKWF